MWKSRWALAALLAAVGLVAGAEEKKEASKDDAPAKFELPPVRQTTCPLSGKPVNPEKTFEYEGTKVAFCCDGCLGKFKKEPLKYLPAVYAQIYPQSIQTRCPVMGGKIDPKEHTDYKGHRVYFCCGGCEPKFTKDADKLLAQWDQISTTQVHCPFSGERIDPTVSVEHDGKPVYFCCKNCAAQFKADPKKYADKVRPEAGVLAYGENAETDIVLCATCLPEGTGHLRKDVKTAEYEGKTYFFCGDDCVKEFKQSPEKYVKLLEKEMKARKPAHKDDKKPHDKKAADSHADHEKH